MKKIKILIADDHDVVRRGLSLLLKSNPRLHLVGEASDGEEALALAKETAPDIVMLDISMPRMNGVETTRAIKLALPAVRVLIFTIHENQEYVYQMIRAGANGYVLKTAEREELFSAIESLAEGGWYFSPSVSKLMIEDYINRSRKNDKLQSGEKPRLTNRETEILGHIAQGMTNAEIAEKLFLSVRTVNTHRNNLMQKLDIHDTASLVRYAVQAGVVDISEKNDEIL